jgi:Uma2 family endonuclease
MAITDVLETSSEADINLEPEKVFTIEEFMELPTNGKRYELVDGKLVEMGQPGDEHGRISLFLARKLADFVEQNKLGLVYGPTGFTIAPRTVRAPDAAFLQASRVPPKTRGPVPVPPDLAVEVISPGDEWSAIIQKIREYQQAGVSLIWSIDPYTPCVFLYHQSDIYPTILKLDDNLDGENLIPGFTLKVATLFE